MIIRDFTHDDLVHVALHARPRDLVELRAVSWAEEPEAIALDLADRYSAFRRAFPDKLSVKVACLPSGRAFAVFGWVLVRPSTAALVHFATPEIRRYRKAFLAAARAMWGPVLGNRAILRVECQTLEGYKEVHRWLDLLGLKREATMRGWGKQGETFVTFSWARP